MATGELSQSHAIFAITLTARDQNAAHGPRITHPPRTPQRPSTPSERQQVIRLPPGLALVQTLRQIRWPYQHPHESEAWLAASE